MENPQPLSSAPVANLSSTIIVAAAKKEDPDRTIRNLHARTYPLEVWYFLASFIFLLSVVNYTGRAIGFYRARKQRRQLSKVPDGSLDQDQATRGPIDLLRLPLALTDTFRALSFRWTISIGQSYTLSAVDILCATGYIVICLTWTLINSTNVKGEKFDPRYYGNLAGYIATLQFPLVVALGMKNNIISVLTGVSFSKLVYLHGVTARVLVILTWVHALGRVKIGLEDEKAVTNPVVQAGFLSGIALTLLAIVSLKPARNKKYEFFLIVHLVLAVICVLAGYCHTAGFRYGHYMWPAILLWSLDRFLRIVRVAANAFGRKSEPAMTTSSELLVSETQLDLLSSSFLRITIPTPRFFYWSPGQCVYLTFPSISKNPLEAHPFTIATIPGAKNPHLKFFIRIRNGVTKQLFKSVENGSNTKVLLDGPYSSPPSLVGYDTVLLIAGGSGISFTLPLLLDLVERSKVQGPACRRLTFAWTIRDIAHLTWIQCELLDAMQCLPAGMTLNVHIFVTGTAKANAGRNKEVDHDLEALDYGTSSENGTGSIGDETEKYAGKETESKIAKGLLGHPLLKTHQGRMNLDKFLTEEVSLAKDVMSVNVCGTHTLAGAVRKAVRYPRTVDILKGGPTISLHVEAFGN